MKSQTTLKPCPFCGSPAQFATVDFGKPNQHEEVACSNNKCWVVPITWGSMSKEKAAENWNDRRI